MTFFKHLRFFLQRDKIYWWTLHKKRKVNIQNYSRRLISIVSPWLLVNTFIRQAIFNFDWDITVFFNCLNTIDTCLDQSNTTWSFCFYTLNTCNHSLNKSAALHFSCNCATHLLLSATHLLLHTTHYFIHKTLNSKMTSHCTIGKTHLFKILNTLVNWEYLLTHLKTLSSKTEHQSASYKKASVKPFWELCKHGCSKSKRQR